MLDFIFRRKRGAIPQAYRTLERREAAQVAAGAGGLLGDQVPPGGVGSMKDPNG